MTCNKVQNREQESRIKVHFYKVSSRSVKYAITFSIKSVSRLILHQFMQGEIPNHVSFGNCTLHSAEWIQIVHSRPLTCAGDVCVSREPDGQALWVNVDQWHIKWHRSHDTFDQFTWLLTLRSPWPTPLIRSLMLHFNLSLDSYKQCQIFLLSKILTFWRTPKIRDDVQNWILLQSWSLVARRHQFNENSWLANAESRFSEWISMSASAEWCAVPCCIFPGAAPRRAPQLPLSFFVYVQAHTITISRWFWTRMIPISYRRDKSQLNCELWRAWRQLEEITLKKWLPPPCKRPLWRYNCQMIGILCADQD
jgi:hypothetical protein